MYLEEYSTKRKKKIFEYEISNGLESVYNTTGRKIISMKNISPSLHPSISPRTPYYTWNINNSLDSIGEINGHVYYTFGVGFCYDNTLIGAVNTGKKKFLNFGSSVLIFPDNKYFDTQDKTLKSLENKTTVKIAFTSSDLGIHAIKSESSSVNLTSLFYEGQGILISGSGNSIVDGYHYITGVDKASGTLYFNNYEFGSAAIPSLSCTISNEIPIFDSVCVCQNRVWGVSGNTIYASKVGDPRSFCAFNRDADSSYKSQYFDTDGFTHIMEYGGSPIVFSKSAIYKVYGNSSKNYELDIVCRGGGILESDVLSVAEMDGEIYYLSHGSPVKFTGAKSVAINNFPYKNMRNGCGAARKNRYYLSCIDENIENKFLIYDSDTGAWYEQNDIWISKMLTVGSCLYGLSTICAYLLDYDGDAPLDADYEGNVDSEIMLDEVFLLGQTICPERVIIRGKIWADSKLDVEIAYDGELLWHNVGCVTGEREGIFYVILPQQRCNSFKLRFKCNGYYCIKNIAVECVE